MQRFKERTGFQSQIAIFTTKVPGIQIYHKTEEGQVDVMMKLGGHSYQDFSDSISPFLHDDIRIKQERNSVLFYKNVPLIDMKEPFEDQVQELDQTLEAIVTLQEFMKELDYGRLEQILMGDEIIESNED